jgi:hypothetical protein
VNDERIDDLDDQGRLSELGKVLLLDPLSLFNEETIGCFDPDLSEYLVDLMLQEKIPSFILS